MHTSLVTPRTPQELWLSWPHWATFDESRFRQTVVLASTLLIFGLGLDLYARCFVIPWSQDGAETLFGSDILVRLAWGLLLCGHVMIGAIGLSNLPPADSHPGIRLLSYAVSAWGVLGFLFLLPFPMSPEEIASVRAYPYHYGTFTIDAFALVGMFGLAGTFFRKKRDSKGMGQASTGAFVALVAWLVFGMGAGADLTNLLVGLTCATLALLRWGQVIVRLEVIFRHPDTLDDVRRDSEF